MERGFEVDNALSVDEAFKKMQSQVFDAIVSDYEMPQKNGLDFLKELREKGNEIPFILFTGKGREDVAVKALNLGADRYLNKNGSPEAYYCELVHAINNTVDRKKSAQLLAASESKYRLLVEKSLQGVLVTRVAPARLVFANQAMGRLLGYSPKELMSLSPEEIKGLVSHEDRAVFFSRMEKRWLGETADTSFEFRAVRKDASIIWLSVFANRVDYGGQPAIQGTFLDVTENKNAGDILRESENRYRELSNCLPNIVFETNLEGQLEFANGRAAEISGYSLREIEEGLNILHFLVPEDREKAMQSIQRLLSGGSYAPAEYTFMRKDGSTFPTLITAAPRFCKNKLTGLRGVVLDITERKKAEEALKESEKMWRAIVTNSPIGIATSGGADDQFLSANEAFCKILGYTEDELRKLTFEDITHPEDLKESVSKMGELENGKIFSFTLEKRYIKKDGTTIYGKIMVSAVRNQNGKPCLFVAELDDITEHKKAEALQKILERKVNNYSEHLKHMVDLRTVQLNEANERLVKAERFAAIGELAGMVGHDLRNPLAGIKNAVYYLKKKDKTISECQAKEMLDIIDKAIDHSDKIINDLLDYSREMQLELSKNAARTLVNEAIGLTQVPDRIQIINRVQEGTWIWVNTNKMIRVFVNLITNAIDAMPEKGTLEISDCQTIDTVELTFADTGIGIPEATLRKLFSPLVTTKAQGMGFGLAICKRIIEAHGGTIKVKTAVNNGTTFTIALPVKPTQ